MKKVLFIMSLLMAVLVVNAETVRTSIKVADLNKAITDNVAKNYVGFTIKESTKVVANNVETFDVVIVKGATSETLVYDKDGKFIKKVTQKVGTVEKNTSTPPAKPTDKPAPKKK
jgi:predicted nicotinamide N-methyase